MANRQNRKKVMRQSDDRTLRQEPVITKLVPLSPINYHVFQWICQSECVDVDAIVEEAFATVEQGQLDCNSDGSVPDSVYTCLSELLAERLSDWEEMWVSSVSGHNYIMCAADAYWLTDPDAAPEPSLDFCDLFVPVLNSAWAQIHPERIAEAILRYKGKWRK